MGYQVVCRAGLIGVIEVVDVREVEHKMMRDATLHEEIKTTNSLLKQLAQHLFEFAIVKFVLHCLVIESITQPDDLLT
jgi:hypothetical protein